MQHQEMTTMSCIDEIFRAYFMPGEIRFQALCTILLAKFGPLDSALHDENAERYPFIFRSRDGSPHAVLYKPEGKKRAHPNNWTKV